MDEAVYGLGLCCTMLPTGVALVIAWLARGRADEAVKNTELLKFRLESLQQELRALRGEVPAPPSRAGQFVASLASSPAVTGPAAPPPAAQPLPMPFERASAPPAAPVDQAAVPPPPAPGDQAALAQPAAPLDQAAAAMPSAPGDQAGPAEPVSEAPPAAAPPPPSPPIDWEKWIGVRGAAVLGGIVFAMAGLYLFKYSIAQGWISPTVRVMSAMLAGLGALVGSQRLRARYAVTANALGGGGIVVLYAATWAAKALYELIPLPLAFVLMVLITATAGVLAVKQDNRLAAYLGLLGGFATPLLLSTGQNAPGALFTYVFLLDLALLLVAWLKRWKSIAALALGGTLLLEFGWVFTRMEPSQVWVAFVVMALFAALFAVFSQRFGGVDSTTTPASRVLQAMALLAPAVVLVYFAASNSLAVPLAPTAGFVAVLLVGAGFIHRKAATGEEMLLTLSVAAGLLVLALAATSRLSEELASVTFLLATLGVGAVGVLNVEWPQDDARRLTSLGAARWLLSGLMAVLLLAAVRAVEAPSHLTFSIGFGVLTLALVLVGRKDAAPEWQVLVGMAPAIAFAIDLISLAVRGSAGDDPVLVLGPSLVLGLALLGFTFFARVEKVLISFTITTLTFAIFATTSLPAQPLQVLYALSAMAVLGVVGAIRGAHRGATFATLALFGLRLAEPFGSEVEALVPWTQLFAVGLSAALLLHVLLFFAGARFHEKQLGPVSLAFALPASFPGLLVFWQNAFGRSAQGALAVGLALVAVASAVVAQRSARSLGSRGVMWLLATACTLLAVAVPLQLENQWVTISWALMAVAWLLLWRRFDARGLKWLALTLLSLVSVRLLFNPWVLDYHQRSGVLFFNWLTYTYLVPAACLVVAAWVLSADEVKRARGWESPFYSAGVPLGASASGISAALVVFAWVTLSVFDYFSPSGALSVSLERLPARDVALSLSWIVYSVALLAIGMGRRSKSLRWMSLVFLLVSTGKVFLYDLGELKDLYRVASLMSLAVSLILISLAYQRFVFRPTPQGSK